ncbi:hypothetical protein Ndes2526A_g07567 [Nannochloris sp. 'desiccata']
MRTQHEGFVSSTVTRSCHQRRSCSGLIIVQPTLKSCRDAALTKLPSLCVHNWVQRYTAALYLQGRQLPTGASMLALVNLFPSLNPFIKAFF